MSRFAELGQYQQEAQELEEQLLPALADTFFLGHDGPDTRAFLKDAVPAFVGYGTKMVVARLSNPDLVLKLGLATMLDSSNGNVDLAEQHEDVVKLAKALERGRGIPYLEQPHTYSLGEPSEVPALITHYVAGESLINLLNYESKVSRLPAHRPAFATLVDTLCTMEDAGVMPEESCSNIIYSRLDGAFHFIDYYRTEDTTGVHTAADAAIMLAQYFGPTYLNSPLPPAGHFFREACRTKFGHTVASDIEASWRPSQDFNPDSWPY